MPACAMSSPFSPPAVANLTIPALPVDRRGVTFVLHDVPATAAAFATDAGKEAVDCETSQDFSGITFAARRIPLWNAIQTATEIVNYRFQIKGNVVIVLPCNVTDEPTETRTYTVAVDLNTLAANGAKDRRFISTASGNEAISGDPAESTIAADSQQNLKQMFGVIPWPTGSSIIYSSSICKLRVINTADNLTQFEKEFAQITDGLKLRAGGQ